MGTIITFARWGMRSRRIGGERLIKNWRKLIRRFANIGLLLASLQNLIHFLLWENGKKLLKIFNYRTHFFMISENRRKVFRKGKGLRFKLGAIKAPLYTVLSLLKELIKLKKLLKKRSLINWKLKVDWIKKRNWKKKGKMKKENYCSRKKMRRKWRKNERKRGN